MRSVEEKANKIVHEDDLEMLQLWLEEVKRIDDKMQSYCNDMVRKFETRLAAHCYGQCVQCDAGLSECQVWEIYGGNSGNSGRQVRTYEMSEGTSASAYVLRPFQTLVPRFRNGEIERSE